MEFWHGTPQGKFMLNLAFGQSKYYIDNLSENVKRGLRQKLRRGERPGLAPLGYLAESVMVVEKSVENRGRKFTVSRMERVTGIGPVARPWEGRILPLYYTRDRRYT